MIPLPFAKAEYQQRLARLRQRMSELGMDLLIVTDVANQHYLTAYDGWSFYTPQVVIVPIEDEQPYWIGRAMDALGGRLTAWMDKDHVLGWPEDHVQTPDRHPMTGSPSGSRARAGARGGSASSSRPTTTLPRPMRG